MIDPDPTTVAQAQAALANIVQTDAGTGLPPLALGGSLIGAYFSDAMYRDLLQATQTNERIANLDTVLGTLAGKLSDKEIAAIRKAAGFDFKRRIRIEAIPDGAREIGLAGAFFSHFGGFFSQKFQDHDFAVGCAEARAWFARWMPNDELSDTLQSGLSASVVPPVVKPAGFDGVDSDDFDKTKGLFADRATALVGRVDAKLGVLKSPLRWLFRHWFRKQLDRYLTDPPN